MLEIGWWLPQQYPNRWRGIRTLLTADLLSAFGAKAEAAALKPLTTLVPSVRGCCFGRNSEFGCCKISQLLCGRNSQLLLQNSPFAETLATVLRNRQ
jgi:hypothetical protein